MKKYKLIKTYPDSPPLGTIFYQKDELGDVYCSAQQKTLNKTTLLHSEFWAGYILTTEDNVDIFMFDTCFVIDQNNKVSYVVVTDENTNLKYFSSEKAVNKYLNIEKKFEKGVWYKSASGNFGLFKEPGSHNKGFVFGNWYNWVNMVDFDENWEVADMVEVENLLLLEAKKRYPIGSVIHSLINPETTLIYSDNEKYEFVFRNNYIVFKDTFNIGAIIVFKGGDWGDVDFTKTTITTDDYADILHPTNNLRWLNIKNTSILQQQYVSKLTENSEWRNIPIIYEKS